MTHELITNTKVENVKMRDIYPELIIQSSAVHSKKVLKGLRGTVAVVCIWDYSRI